MGLIYNFKEEDAERFARHIGAKSRTRGSQLELITCPYCRASDKWTFGISRNTGQFECKRASCGVKGNMITLSRDFDFSLGKDTDAYYGTVDYSRKQYKRFKDAHRIIESKPKAIEYLKNRGISEEVIKQYEITTRTDNEDILVFPFKDMDGEMVFIKYRNTAFVKGETKGSKEFCEAGCKPILFGMNHCDMTCDTLIITEGQIDSLSVITAGIKNAVSVPTGCNGFTWIPYCFDFVNQFKKIIVFGDCENGHITLADELAKRWDSKVRVCRPEDYQGCKDANEILQKFQAVGIQRVIENAEAKYDEHIKPMSKVQQVDIMKIPAISTGMSNVDAVLDGGFRLGQLAVLTGKRGEGKSTIASMWGVEALHQGFNCFFYSGELMDFFFRNWMDCQITGKATHTPSEDDKLNAWYGDKAFIYDETIAEGDELKSLLHTVEIAIIQRNCKFILLDNLMTAIDVDLDVDIYRSQSKFVGDLAKLAKKYEVFILLIAHPRKENYQKNLTNDSVSGSSNITDKADIVLTYARPDFDEDENPDHRRLQITKNRLTGKLAENGNALKLVYDSSGSRRVAEATSKFFSLNYGWDKEIYTQIEIDDSTVIPF